MNNLENLKNKLKLNKELTMEEKSFLLSEITDYYQFKMNYKDALQKVKKDAEEWKENIEYEIKENMKDLDGFFHILDHFKVIE